MPKNYDNGIFYYSIQIKVLKNESNLIESFRVCLDEGIQILWGEFHCLDNNLKNV